MSINYGAPIYPNCFDQLTTHGIVAEDVVGYITDSPSPYLQNYVAQRGGYTPSVPWTPSIPGRVLPDPLPSVSPQGGPVMGYEPPRMQERLPRGDVYQTVPNEREINHVVKNEKNNTWKKVAAGILLTGLAVFGIVKGRQIYKSGNAGLKNIGNWFSNAGNKIGNAFKNGWTTTCDFFQSCWNKLFKKNNP